MNVSILHYFDKLGEVCRLCEDVLAGKKESSVPEQYNQISVRMSGFQAPFVTLPEEQQENYLKRSVSRKV